jgi:hypothetical protein
VLERRDAADVTDPESDLLLDPLHECRVFEALLEVFGGHLSAGGLALFELGAYFRVVLQFDLWHYDILGALRELELQLRHTPDDFDLHGGGLAS